MKDEPNTTEKTDETKSLSFIEEIIVNDLKNKKNEGRLLTRFPPEPNGYIHIGHAKSICFNFGLAERYNGKCNLRFDDTNPTKEETEYVDAIMEDIKWLGFTWNGEPRYASDYFEQLYQWAEKLIINGKAYICALTPEQMSEYRGTPTRPGKDSPCRNRPVDENLDIFRRMRKGEFEDGTYMLRAKIDMASPNMHKRDPVIYRIRHAHHHRTGNAWCIYPTYDFAHGQSDYIEGITHSICTLEFEVHRPLYDWLLDNLIDTDYRPRQIEFARLNLNYTVMSKRKLMELVKGGYVNGWDDPRMPTVCGLRRRGYTPEAIRNFAEKVGIAKRDNVIDVALLEHSIREDLNKKALRTMAVLDPLKVVIQNYPDNTDEELDAINNPEDESMGSRTIPFSKVLYIERDDFMENPPKDYFRLSVGKEVRLRYAYFIKCTDVQKDENGKITEIHCTYDPASKGGKSPDGRKVKGTLHWVSAKHAIEAEVRLYDRLFINENPNDADDGKTFIDNLNPNSLEVRTIFVEPTMKSVKPLDKFQFERLGYFSVDYDTNSAKVVFNRTVQLRDTWAKISAKS